jgi:hypothetical protein
MCVSLRTRVDSLCTAEVKQLSFVLHTDHVYVRHLCRSDLRLHRFEELHHHYHPRSVLSQSTGSRCATRLVKFLGKADEGRPALSPPGYQIIKERVGYRHGANGLIPVVPNDWYWY